MRPILFSLFTPWLLDKTMPGEKPFRVPGVYLVAGLLVVPAVHVGLWLADALFQVGVDLPAPQAGLMAAVADGILGSAPEPPGVIAAKLGAGLTGWLIGGVAGAFLWISLLGSLLSGLRGRLPIERGPSAWRAASIASGYLPLGVLPGILWIDVYARIKVHEPGMLAVEIAIASFLTLWFFAGLAVTVRSWLRHVVGKNPGRSTIDAILAALLAPLFVWLVASVAFPLTWLPVKWVAGD